MSPKAARLRLNPLRHKDLRRCAELERELFGADDPWSERVFADELAYGNYYLGAYLHHDLVGYAGLGITGKPPHHQADVHTIAVAPTHQGGGVGTALLRALLARADAERAPVYLEVRTDNDRAIALYTAHGFRTIGTRKAYYQPSGADAYTMMRPAIGVGDDETR
ncbi:MAG: ribosomal protein S18-alanine N-acetyltransferase [Sciscionella sp.]|nr:ribosomal protein S18-alanine N-acetyltransferase [Sciscionella sp.]